MSTPLEGRKIHITCPKCGEKVAVHFPLPLANDSIIHVVPGGSVVPCPRCGFNLEGEFRELQYGSHASRDWIVLAIVGVVLLIASVLWFQM